jgi:diguanylate cyclase (GGDEF)-like protein/PAS domain S-box-containing protein
LEFIHPDDQERAVANWMEMLSHRQAKRIRLRHRCQDGSWLWVEVENVILATESGEPLIETQLSDISEEMAAYEQVRQREQLFRRLAESLPTGVLQVDQDRRVVYANTRLTAILGMGRGTTLTDQLASLIDADRACLEAAVDAALTQQVDHDMEIELQLPQTGESRRCTATIVAVTGPEGTCGALVSITDITDAARMREELRARATYDALTGCLNRSSIMASLQQALTWDHDRLTGVVYIDLDKFKAVNDTLGHAAGDELLIHVAACLTGLLCGQDQVGRLGGDEFLVICHDLDDPTQATQIADRIRDLLQSPVTLTAGPTTPGASIGVAVGTVGTSADDLVAQADAAMYEAKKHRDGRIVTSNPRPTPTAQQP